VHFEQCSPQSLILGVFSGPAVTCQVIPPPMFKEFPMAGGVEQLVRIGVCGAWMGDTWAHRPQTIRHSTAGVPAGPRSRRAAVTARPGRRRLSPSRCSRPHALLSLRATRRLALLILHLERIRHAAVHGREAFA
jgi:hypothetical protein